MCILTYKSFNSKLVRLEDCTMLSCIKTKLVKFQFQIGAIRSRRASPIIVKSLLKFQFQIGAIRSPCLILRHLPKGMFQFQIGAIRS